MGKSAVQKLNEELEKTMPLKLRMKAKVEIGYGKKLGKKYEKELMRITRACFLAFGVSVNEAKDLIPFLYSVVLSGFSEGYKKGKKK